MYIGQVTQIFCLSYPIGFGQLTEILGQVSKIFWSSLQNILVKPPNLFQSTC